MVKKDSIYAENLFFLSETNKSLQKFVKKFCGAESAVDISHENIVS